MIVEVAPALPIFKNFYYTIPPRLEKNMRPGLRVLAPFGPRFVTGYILQIVDPDKISLPEGRDLKPISDVLDEFPLYPPALLNLFMWISRYYHYPLGKVIECALPGGLNVASKRRSVLTEAGGRALEEGSETPEDTAILDLLRGGRDSDFSKRSKTDRAAVSSLLSKGLLECKQVLGRPRIGLKEEQVVSLQGSVPEEIMEGKEILDRLREENGSVPLKSLKKITGYRASILKRLEKKNLVSIKKVAVFRDPFSGDQLWYERPSILTTEQQESIRAIDGALRLDEFCTYLLHGITSSGKTEVYLAAVEAALSLGKNAIVLVPEIALATYLEGAFLSRFGDKVAVLHSGLSAGERLDQWMRIIQGKANVVIGARSAVFAPFSSVGLIIVDEEHDSSYKQEDMLRYHGRDLSVMRAHLEKAVVILGSATPSVQTMFNARSGRYRYLSLPNRIENRLLPDVHIIDMRQPVGAKVSLFCPELLAEIEKNLERGEQTLLFLNRRGFSPSMQCIACGKVLCCPNCSVSLTYHSSEKVVLCHYCGFSIPALPVCPSCKGSNVRQLGWGTERVETELKNRFPQARIARMDRDTVSNKRSLRNLLRAMQEREIDILVGTQMVTKGHDFPYITLVGVISADLSLNLPDFRAAEKTFQLLAQVAGRAGRGNMPGRVFIQTRSPEQYSILRAKGHDFLGFYEEEISRRQALAYPPYARLANILLISNCEKKVCRCAEEVVKRAGAILNLDKCLEQAVQVLGPAPAPVFKLRGKFRYQVFLKGNRPEPLHSFISCLLEDFEKKPLMSGVKLIVDVDPEGMV